MDYVDIPVLPKLLIVRTTCHPIFSHLPDPRRGFWYDLQELQLMHGLGCSPAIFNTRISQRMTREYKVMQDMICSFINLIIQEREEFELVLRLRSSWRFALSPTKPSTSSQHKSHQCGNCSRQNVWNYSVYIRWKEQVLFLPSSNPRTEHRSHVFKNSGRHSHRNLLQCL